MKKIAILLFGVTLFLGCNRPSSDKNEKIYQENLVLSTIWFQQSPEAKALYFQGFNIAKERVLEFSSEKKLKPQAVVVDLDETMIDNSPFQGKMIESGKPFSHEMWLEWSALAKAKALPGAIDFTHFCDSLGVTVIFISNRNVSELDWTMQNMKDLGFAFVVKDNYLLKDTTSGKEPRRKKISEKYDIVLFLGDNLNDFSEAFESRGDDWGVSIVNEYRDEFGQRFIVFPNPMYGEWEKNIYLHKRNLSEEEKFMLRRGALNHY